MAALKRIVAARPQTTSLLLVAAGLMGALGGGWLIGVWAFGLVLIAESAGLIGWGLHAGRWCAGFAGGGPAGVGRA